MTLEMDYSADFADWDLAEPVAVASVGTALDGAPAAQSFVTALRAQPSVKERAPTGGVYAGSDLTWLLPAPLLLGLVPKPGDTITEQQPADRTVPGPAPELTWTILTLGFDQLDRLWSCYAVNLVLAYQLRSAATFFRPVTNQDAAGSRKPSFFRLPADIPCRFQLTSEDVTQERGKRLWVGMYDVYLASEVTGITSEWQVRDPDDHVYEVLGTRNRQRIDELSLVQCRRTGDAT